MKKNKAEKALQLFLQEWITLEDLERRYIIKASSIRAYVARKQVIPDKVLAKVGKQWLIAREYAEMKWEQKLEQDICKNK